MYYEVAVKSKSFYGSDALTYKSDGAYAAGEIVRVPIGKKNGLGMIVRPVKKPAFLTKKITGSLDIILPTENLELLSWLNEYYPAPLGLTVGLFIPNFSDTFTYSPQVAQSENFTSKSLPPLTSDQKKALANVHSESQGTLTLHGQTGSGKTRVYTELAREACMNGKSSLILVPEIGLTRQMSRSFREVFGPESVIVVHSNQTAKGRRDAWLRCYTFSQAQIPHIVIGPRSALFMPVSHLGLIVMDESHEPAYKQEQLPHYHTARVASQLARLHECRLVLGSATPGTIDYYLAEQKSAPIIAMTQQAAGGVHDLRTTVVDLRDKQHFTAHRFMSTQLLDAISKRLTRQEQSLIFLNRRGSARVVSCQDCGWHATCPHCDISLVYHGDHGRIRCHTCGYSAQMPTSCPTCHSLDILFKNIGTKAVVEFLQKRFPQARIARFDLDNSAEEKIEKAYETVVKGDVDIIVGTQIIAKGLDLPRLSLVGVLQADTGLSMPDFTANERTFQLLYQVIGRVGRGHSQNNEAIVQTFEPDNWVLQTALQKNWRDFYEHDLAEREKFGFPPFYYLLRVVATAARRTTAENRLQEIRDKLYTDVGGIQILGPSPCFIEKTAGKYRLQLVIKAKQRSRLVQAIHLLPPSCSYDLDPQNLL